MVMVSVKVTVKFRVTLRVIMLLESNYNISPNPTLYPYTNPLP